MKLRFWSLKLLKPSRLPRNRILVIFIALAILSSIPNLGIFFDETICATKPCPVVKLKNPVILPYSWAFPEKKCNYCNHGESAISKFYVNEFPLVHLLNMTVGVSFLLMLSIFINFGLVKFRENFRHAKNSKGFRQRKA